MATRALASTALAGTAIFGSCVYSAHLHNKLRDAKQSSDGFAVSLITLQKEHSLLETDNRYLRAEVAHLTMVSNDYTKKMTCNKNLDTFIFATTMVAGICGLVACGKPGQRLW